MARTEKKELTKIITLLFAFLILSAFLIVSCEQKNSLEESGNALVNSYEKSKKAGEDATLKNIQSAIQIYRATNGEYPNSLKDIENLMRSQIDSNLYQYNPETGEIKLK